MDSMILTIENSLSSKNCKKIIDLFEKSKNLHAVGQTGQYLNNSTQKKSTDINIDSTFLLDPEWNSNITEILNCLNFGIDSYVKKYPFVNSLDKWAMVPRFNIQRYCPGEGYYAWHCESGGPATRNRVLAWMIYLNDIADGGTEFAHGNEPLTAKEGTLSVWPAYFTHYHRGIISQSNTKYIATGWYAYTE